MRLLYVEDDRINALLFEQALEGQDGIELRLAETGDEALGLVADWRPNVVVLDAHLPDTTGHALLARLRALPGLADAPAFMCSADDHADDLAAARDAGFHGYWVKPVDAQRVLADLAALMLPRR